MRSDDDRTALAIVRSLIKESASTVSPNHGEALRSNANRYLFDDGRIGDATWIIASALEAIPTLTGLEDTSNEDLQLSWQMLLNRTHGEFILHFDRLSGGSISKFRDACASVFGINEDQVGALIREYHDLIPGKRFAIILSISESPSFAYLNDLVDNYEGGVVLEPFDSSWRELMQRTFQHG